MPNPFVQIRGHDEGLTSVRRFRARETDSRKRNRDLIEVRDDSDTARGYSTPVSLRLDERSGYRPIVHAVPNLPLRNLEQGTAKLITPVLHRAVPAPARLVTGRLSGSRWAGRGRCGAFSRRRSRRGRDGFSLSARC